MTDIDAAKHLMRFPSTNICFGNALGHFGDDAGSFLCGRSPNQF